MDTKEKEELFKLEVENLSLLEGREIKGGGEGSGKSCTNQDVRTVVTIVQIEAASENIRLG